MVKIYTFVCRPTRKVIELQMNRTPRAKKLQTRSRRRETLLMTTIRAKTPRSDPMEMVMMDRFASSSSSWRRAVKSDVAGSSLQNVASVLGLFIPMPKKAKSRRNQQVDVAKR